MTAIIALPGKGCAHWYADRCLYNVHLNPGLEREKFCQVLQRLEQHFDEHVRRCERFGLSAEKAGQLWKRYTHQVLERAWDCPDYRVEFATGIELICTHLCGDVCLLRLPKCLGRCRHFELWSV